MPLSKKILIGGDDVVNGKPEPDMLFLACERLSLTPSEVLMIGDSKFDKKAAEKAGLDPRIYCDKISKVFKDFNK